MPFGVREFFVLKLKFKIKKGRYLTAAPLKIKTMAIHTKCDRNAKIKEIKSFQTSSFHNERVHLIYIIMAKAPLDKQTWVNLEKQHAGC